MRYLVFSDLHGSIIYAKKIIEEFKSGNYDKMLCLGDILYHGPRNDLPNGYNPKEVIKLLNEYKDYIIAVKGNCDAYVDSMVLDFIIHDEYEFLYNGKRIIMTHGHIINPEKHLNLSGAIILYGHTHIYKADMVSGSLYLNPGSTTIPKNNNSNSYAVIEDNTFIVYDFNKNILLKQEI